MKKILILSLIMLAFASCKDDMAGEIGVGVTLGPNGEVGIQVTLGAYSVYGSGGSYQQYGNVYNEPQYGSTGAVKIISRPIDQHEIALFYENGTSAGTGYCMDIQLWQAMRNWDYSKGPFWCLVNFGKLPTSSLPPKLKIIG